VPIWAWSVSRLECCRGSSARHTHQTQEKKAHNTTNKNKNNNCRLVKVVALDGTVVKRNGYMTGGGLDGTEYGARAGSRWDEKALATAIERRDKLLNEEEAVRRKLRKRLSL